MIVRAVQDNILSHFNHNMIHSTQVYLPNKNLYILDIKCVLFYLKRKKKPITFTNI